ncbi:Hypothetical predicted protein [Cloeon dipterum]|uniref:Uncharacterized protein n=1 Tax=Cloeon dipterum TaxID=197152 RepID=A0A8S1DQS0_9INSE|nr:Hypothetical predicted protein [Cloeon dipterum]
MSTLLLSDAELLPSSENPGWISSYRFAYTLLAWGASAACIGILICCYLMLKRKTKPADEEKDTTTLKPLLLKVPIRQSAKSTQNPSDDVKTTLLTDNISNPSIEVEIEADNSSNPSIKVEIEADNRSNEGEN